MLKEGDKAPLFELPGDDGHVHSLTQSMGNWVVLYFYPQDLTPGCTTEACEFNEALNELSQCDAVVLGVSKDSLASHVRFKSKYGLGFPLLSDADLAIHKAYGAFGEKTNYGKTSIGTIRTTVVIDPNGKVAKIWSKVRVKDHVKAVTDWLQKVNGKATELMSKAIRLRGK